MYLRTFQTLVKYLTNEILPEIAPLLAWDACSLIARSELSLMHDMNMLNMMENHTGGFCCVGSKRHVKANDTYFTSL